jgi:hypothetical protein
MSDFAPSASAAAAALKAKGVTAPIVEKSHPGGAKGARFSLDEVAKRAWIGRNDPRIRAWAIRAINEAKASTKKDRAKAIFNKLKSQTSYVPDPTRSEVVVRPDWTLCLDEFGLCFKGGDCFPAETLLLKASDGDADDERVAIKDIQVGDTIWGLHSWVKVEAKAYKGLLSVWEIAVRGRKRFRLTKDHHVTVLNIHGGTRKIRVRDLAVGDVLVRPNIAFGNERLDVPLVTAIREDVEVMPCFDIQTEDSYVYLPEADVTVNQCDDLSIALAAAFMSVDLDTRIVAHSYDKGGIPTHVLVGCDTEEGFKRADPSTTLEFGDHVPYVKEWQFDPYDTKPPPIDGNSEAGDFVGVGRPPMPQVAMLGLGDDPSVGLQIKEWLTGNALLNPLRLFELSLAKQEQAVESLGLALQTVEQVRQQLNPTAPYDPEPNGVTITDLSQFPSDDSGIWTQGMATVAADLYLVGRTLVHMGKQAMSGDRPLYVYKNDILIATKTGDPWHLNPATHTASDTLLVFYDPAGNIMSGVWGTSGKALTAAQVQAALAANTGATGATGTGALPVIAVVAIVAVIAVAAGLTAYGIMHEHYQTAEFMATQATDQSVVNCITSGKCTPEQGQQILATVTKANTDFKKAQTELAKQSPIGQIGDTLTTSLKWLAVGGITAGAFYLLRPVVEKWASKP